MVRIRLSMRSQRLAVVVAAAQALWAARMVMLAVRAVVALRVRLPSVWVVPEFRAKEMMVVRRAVPVSITAQAVVVVLMLRGVLA